MGPFPAGHVQQSILLGRIGLDDHASKDKENWLPVRKCADLIPEVLMLGKEIENRKERIEAAKRWADERRHERRDGEDPLRTNLGRRDEESLAVTEYRQQRETGFNETKIHREKILPGIIMAISFLVVVGAVGFFFPAPEPESAQCGAPAAANVNWEGCQFVGLQSLKSELAGAVMANANFESASFVGSNLNRANLSYVNFKNANLSFASFKKSRLIGADLRKADLSNADFQEADLSYANLSGANIKNVNFLRASLKNTIWIDGKTCLSMSVGECKTQ